MGIRRWERYGDMRRFWEFRNRERKIIGELALMFGCLDREPSQGWRRSISNALTEDNHV